MRSSIREPRLRPHERPNGSSIAPGSDKKTNHWDAREMSNCLSNLHSMMGLQGITIKRGPAGRPNGEEDEAKIVIGGKMGRNEVSFSIHKGPLVHHCVAKKTEGPFSREGLKKAFEASGVKVPVVLA